MEGGGSRANADAYAQVDAAASGFGIAYVPEKSMVAEHLRAGPLKMVLSVIRPIGRTFARFRSLSTRSGIGPEGLLTALTRKSVHGAVPTPGPLSA